MYQTKRFAVLVVMIVCMIFLLQASGIAADAKVKPSVDKTSILIKTVKQLFWAGKDRQVHKWTPSIEFRVNGPLAAGAQIYAEYSINGKPWVNYKCEDIGEINERGYWNTYGGREAEPLRGKAVTHTGPVSFVIRAKNPIGNTIIVLYTGVFTIKKLPYPWSKTPQYKEAYTYYVDYDWALPIGLLTWARKEMNVDWQVPLYSPCLFYMWFKGDEHKHRPPQAFLYYNGKKIGDTTGSNGACWEKMSALTWEASDQSYHFYQFIFSKAWSQMKKGTTPANDAFLIWRNPGEYEIKVLWDGKLVRTAKWTVESDGWIPDHNLSLQLNAKSFQPEPNQWTDWVTPMPVTITENLNIPFDKAAWKTGMYFGNPLKGFVAP